ncbi:TonB-dependent receptor [Polaromonas eurypsychrophila]|uniref:TonB-dependent receptor n=2 Tax=Polaromonas eurypsychrophila TaxID=1614635 RepID=A0A916SN84_9BURK|nr:TonB-dependent receptor [Polaromonas eurypsychrophila]
MLPLGALMLAASVSGWAQSSAAPGAEQTLKTVTVTETVENKDTLQTKKTSIGKGTQDIRDIPQSISVMTEKLIDDRKLDTLKDALHHTAGITFAATENGTDQDIRLRGFPVATVGDLLIDGMRDPSQYDRDTFNYDRIEILRGSASMLFGRGSTGGVINQVTKQPQLLDQNDFETTIGSRGYVRTTADFNLRTGEDAALRLNVMANKADNGGANIDKYGIAPTYRWGIGSRDEFSVGLFHLNVDNVPQSSMRYVDGNVPNVRAGNFYGTQSDYLLGQATHGTAKHTHRFAEGGELRSQVRSGVFDRAQWGTNAAFAAAPLNPATVTGANLGPSTVLQRQGLTPRKDRFNGTYFQSDYSNEVTWLGMKHQILTGVDAASERANRYLANNGIGANFNKGNTTIGTPNDGRTLAVAPVYRDSSNYTASSMGAYVQDLVQVAPHWKLLGGVRYDKFKGDFNNLVYAAATGNTLTRTDNAQMSIGAFSYRSGVLYQPTPSASFHFSYGTSFNTNADTYQYTTQQTANTPPEKSRNIELGAKLDWLDGKLSTRAALFRTEKSNERTTDADFAGTAFLLSGKRHTAGIELDVVGRLTPQWEVYFSYAYTPIAKIDAAGSNAAAQATVGQRVGLTPKHSGSAWVSYQATPKFRVAGGVNGSSENFALAGTSGAAQLTARAASYLVADAMAEYKFTQDTYMQFNVTNIGSKIYGDQLYPGFVITGAPRTVKMTVGTRF